MKRTTQLCKPALTPDQAMAQFNREARLRAPGRLEYEVYDPVKHNPITPATVKVSGLLL